MDIVDKKFDKEELEEAEISSIRIVLKSQEVKNLEFGEIYLSKC